LTRVFTQHDVIRYIIELYVQVSIEADITRTPSLKFGDRIRITFTDTPNTATTQVQYADRDWSLTPQPTLESVYAYGRKVIECCVGVATSILPTLNMTVYTAVPMNK
jgi:hypothetical protein